MHVTWFNITRCIFNLR